MCRREGTKLFLKGDRCYTDKCAYDRRPYAPGQHGRARKKVSDYAVQLREKQKVRRVYGVLERQFRGYFHKADMAKGVTGANLLAILERRLDNVIYRLGFANSRQQARQLVRHGIFTLNGRKVNIPSLQVRVGDTVEVPEANRKIPVIAEAQEVIARRGCPSWLEVDGPSFKGVVKALPQREDIQFPINEHLIVELYSK
ncbi:ribosomal protein S4 [Desulfovibrio sp. A2]|jgi:small subunit ribosomal protein S4|nr:ribosomal protein S4 [Desulfovibrio sp. A2]